MQALTKSQIKKLPRYVRIINDNGSLGSALRLANPEYGLWGWNKYRVVYFRDGGHWEVGIYLTKENRLFSINPDHSQIHHKELIPTTYWDWKKDNGVYTSKKTKAYRV